MAEKLIIVFLLLIIPFLLASEVYLPEYYLDGVQQPVGNTVDYFRIQKGSLALERRLSLLSSIRVKVETEIDYENELVELRLLIDNREIYPPIYVSLQTYLQGNFRRTFKQSALEMVRTLLEDEQRSGDQGLIPEIVIDLPKIALPKAVRKFMGNKAGRLNLDGSQKLTLSASETTRETAQKSEQDQSGDLTLEMRQDLDLRLRGTIGEKIHVDVTHRSSSDGDMLSNPNEINISYQGFEDEIVKSIEGGNIALSLSGSRFINYSASSEGLFGVKSLMEVGNLKLTAIIGKDEAKKSKQKYRGDTQADSINVQSHSYIKRKHYFIDDPELLYELYTEADGVDSSWVGNAIKTNELGEWIIKSPQLIPDVGSLRVYLDNDEGSDNDSGYEGMGSDGELYYFDELYEGTGFSFDYDTGILTIYLNNVDARYTIGVYYTVNGQPVGNSDPQNLYLKILKKKNQSTNDEQYWKLTARNFYDLGIQNVKSTGFSLDVFKYNSDNTKNFSGEMGVYNDYLRLNTNGDDLINNDDATVDLAQGRIYFPFLRPFEVLGDYVYDSETYYPPESWDFWIAIKGDIGRDQISLNQINILPGSIDIKIKYQDGSSKTLKEDLDYVVDYDFGTVTFLNTDAKNTDNELDITYQFKPIFSIDSKTLMGVRADLDVTDNLKLGGTFIYQSEVVSDDHPRIGSENRSIILADIDGSVSYELPFITRLVDWLPFIRTDEDSRLSLSGEVAMSLPRIYGSDEQKDKKEAYLDDLESVLESFPFGVMRPTWLHGSKPYNIDYGKADMYWYRPDNIYAREIYDTATLTDKEEREEVTVLACKLNPPDIGVPGTDTRYWGGIMKYLGNQINFSRKKYIEVLAKVDSLPGVSTSLPVIMHINLGDISEDFYTDFGGLGVLNTEDGKNGGYYDGSFQFDEDVGLDGIKNGDPGDDPDDDQRDDSMTIDGEKEWPYLNGTENNGVLDTEDLDSNGYLNTSNVYFEYSIPLTDDNSPYLISEYKGWRLYRIPLKDPDPNYFQMVSDQESQNPDLERISYARVWFEVEDKTRIKIVSMDLVGNKWEEAPIKVKETDRILTSDELMEGESFLVGVIDNQKNDHYEPAPHTVIKKDGTPQVEQSLLIDYKRLQPGNYGIARQRLSDARNVNKGLDLLGYERIRFWAYKETETDVAADSLIFRLGADSLNYYEVLYPLEHQLTLNQPSMDKNGWTEIDISFAEFSYLKNLKEYGDTSYVAYRDSLRLTFKKVGRPTLSNVKQISIGILAVDEFNGILYIDDIRVANPYEEIGFAAQTNFSTSFADFSTLDVTFKWQTPNFQTSASRDQNSSYEQKTELNIVNKYFLQKFFPAEWGLSMPLTLTRNYSIGRPRFKVNSDILVEDLSAEEQEREKSESLVYGASLNFSQNKTPANKILAYTVKNTTINTSVQKKNLLSASAADTSLSYTIKHIYKLNIPKEALNIGLFSSYKIYFFPNTFENSLTYKVEYPNKWRWETYSSDVPKWVPQTNQSDIKSLDTDSYIKYDILSELSASYKLNTKRDLLLDGELFGVPLGIEKNRTQTINIDYDPVYFDKIFTLNSDAKVVYKEDRKKISSSVSDDENENFRYEGNVNRDFSVNLKLKNKDIFSGITAKFEQSRAKKEQEKADKKREEEEKEQEKKLKESEIQDSLNVSPLTEPVSNKNEDNSEDEQDNPDEEINDQEIKSEPVDKKDQSETEKEGLDIFGNMFSLFSRLDNISMTYSNNYGTNYEQRMDKPEFLYQLGVPDILTDEELRLKDTANSISANTGVLLLNNLSTDWSYSIEFRHKYGSQGTSGTYTRSTTFPSVSATLQNFEKLIKAEKLLTSSRLTSSYRVSEEYTENIITDLPQSKRTTVNFQPLISWTGNWVSNVTSSLSFNFSNTENIAYSTDLVNTIRNESKYSLNGNLSWSFTAARGLKIPFLKKKIALKNELTTQLGVSYEKMFNTKKTKIGKETERDQIKYGISPGASYKFNNSISAGLTSNYDYSHDRQTNIKIIIFRLSIWIEILF